MPATTQQIPRYHQKNVTKKEIINALQKYRRIFYALSVFRSRLKNGSLSGKCLFKRRRDKRNANAVPRRNSLFFSYRKLEPLAKPPLISFC